MAETQPGWHVGGDLYGYRRAYDGPAVYLGAVMVAETVRAVDADNARRFAASADLLKALKAAEDFLTDYFGPVDATDPSGWSDDGAKVVVENARAAIRAAEGR